MAGTQPADTGLLDSWVDDEPDSGFFGRVAVGQADQSPIDWLTPTQARALGERLLRHAEYALELNEGNQT